LAALLFWLLFGSTLLRLGNLFVALLLFGLRCLSLSSLLWSSSLFLFPCLISSFLICFFQALQTDMTHHINEFRLYFLHLGRCNFHSFQFFRHNVLLVERFDLPDSINSEGVL